MRNKFLLRPCYASTEFLGLPCSRWRFRPKAVIVTNQALLCLGDRSPLNDLFLLFIVMALALLVELHLKGSRARVLQVSLL